MDTLNNLKKESNGEQYIKININDPLTQVSDNKDDINKINATINNDNSVKEPEDLDVSEEFKINVVTYIKCDNAIKEKLAEIKILKEKKNKCEEYILSYLDEIGENTIEIKGGKLRRNKVETKKSISPDTILKIIEEEIKDSNKIKNILTKMETKRQVIVKTNLKRISDKKTK